MNKLCALLDSDRYRAEVKTYGPVLARHELWREADRRARRIMERLVPPVDFVGGFHFRDGPDDFVARSRARAHHGARRMMVLEYARDQILAKLQRRVGLADIAREFIK